MRVKMEKDKELRALNGIIFSLMNDFISSLTDAERRDLGPVFDELVLDLLTRKDGPYPLNSKKRKDVCSNNDRILEELFDCVSTDESKTCVVQLQHLNNHLKNSMQP
jgi:hypothetical protein